MIVTLMTFEIGRRINEVCAYFTSDNIYRTAPSGYRAGVDSDLSTRLYLALLAELSVNHSSLKVSLALSLLLCVLLALVAQLFSRDMVQETEKKSPYECGFFPFDSATRLPFDVHFYVVGIMFLVFDVELIILTTIIILAATMPWTAFAGVAVFIIILTVGFVYEWNCGALRWESKIPEPVQRPSTTSASLPLIFTLFFLVDLSDYLDLFYSLVFQLLGLIVYGLVFGVLPVRRKARKVHKVRKVRKARKGRKWRKDYKDRAVVMAERYMAGYDLYSGEEEGSKLRVRAASYSRKAVYTWRRRAVPSGPAPSWRPRLWRQRTYFLGPVEGALRWEKIRFWKLRDDSLFATKRWRGYHARYSRIKRVQFLFRTRVIPSLHFNLARMHRWPPIIVTSLFIIPILSVPIPWFIDDYDIAWGDLINLHDYICRGINEHSYLAEYFFNSYATKVVAVLFLYPVAVLNILCDYEWPLMLLVGLAMARQWYVYAYGVGPWNVYRQFFFDCRRRSWGRRLLRARTINEYDVYVEELSDLCPHPDAGQEDVLSKLSEDRRAHLTLLQYQRLRFDKAWSELPLKRLSVLLLVLVVSTFSAVNSPLLIIFPRVDQAFLDKWWLNGERLLRSTAHDLYIMLVLFNRRSNMVSLLILVCGAVHGFTGLLIPPVRRLMHPGCKQRVLPSLSNALLLFVSLCGLWAWWRFNPCGRQRYLDLISRTGHLWWLGIFNRIMWSTSVVCIVAWYAHIRRTQRWFGGRQHAIAMRARLRRNLWNRRFLNRVFEESVGLYKLPTKQFASSRAAIRKLNVPIREKRRKKAEKDKKRKKRQNAK